MLQSVKRCSAFRHSTNAKGIVNRLPFKLLLGTAVALSIVMIIALGIRERSQPASVPRMRQLTANSSEVPIRTAAISPDGKYLAFSDIGGLHIKNIETGESSTVPFSQAPAGERVDWQIM